jgi:hypothetical protein
VGGGNFCSDADVFIGDTARLRTRVRSPASTLHREASAMIPVNRVTGPGPGPRGRMTAVMRAVDLPTEPRVLRNGLVIGGVPFHFVEQGG